uniref:E3 ubiquitin-protein ligase E3D n=1 Tax=Mesocestoides corti TaxID=53468 RepID=A0A5K3EW59_MESCO
IISPSLQKLSCCRYIFLKLIFSTNGTCYLALISPEIFSITVTSRTSEIPENPVALSINMDDPYLDDENISDNFVERTLKFCEPDTYVVEIYGLTTTCHSESVKRSYLVELLGQFLIYLTDKQCEVCETLQRSVYYYFREKQI